ncbi:hypothetical protein DMUE_4906 [Dictyocoela muelleri]|nr:hypothetical protein DMUE_4906 [Dictyocoela muelleri]
MLESIEEQDLLTWKDEFLQTIKVAGWNEQTAIGVLRASISSKYIDMIQKHTNLNSILQEIFSKRYPPEKQLKYQNKLFTIYQDNYRTIKEYKQDIILTTNKLAICLGWTNEQMEMKIEEAFYSGLYIRTKLEMVRLNVQNTTAIYNLINTTE